MQTNGQNFLSAPPFRHIIMQYVHKISPIHFLRTSVCRPRTAHRLASSSELTLTQSTLIAKLITVVYRLLDFTSEILDVDSAFSSGPFMNTAYFYTRRTSASRRVHITFFTTSGVAVHYGDDQVSLEML
jgi:hypothetical protein